MTAPAPAVTRAAKTAYPALASTALRPLLTPAPTVGRVLGAGTTAVWLEAGDECIVIEQHGAGLPNGLVSPDFRHETIGVGDEARLGPDRIDFDGVALRIARWWDPRPPLGGIDGPSLAEGMSRLPRPPIEDGGLEAALQSGRTSRIEAASLSLVGRGDGLTPQGDDVLAGTLATLRLLGEGNEVAETFASLVLAHVRDRTTLLSRSLLRHAAAGRVARPVADLLTTIARSADPGGPYRRILAMGHSSGPALAAGIHIAARVLAGGTE